VKLPLGALLAFCLASCSSGIDDATLGATKTLSGEAGEALANSGEVVESSSETPTPPANVDTSFDGEMRLGSDLLDLPDEAEFQPSSATGEGNGATVITRPPSE